MGLCPIPHLRNFFVKKFLKNLQKTLAVQFEGSASEPTAKVFWDS